MTDPAIKLFGRTIQFPDSSGAHGDDSLPEDNNGEEEDEEAHKVLSHFVIRV